MGRVGICIFLSLVSFCSVATEIDDTSSYYLKIADSEDYLDFKVQEIFDQALTVYSGCKAQVFLGHLSVALTGDLFYGSVERFANDAHSIEKYQPPISESIYKGTPYETSIVGRLFGLGAVINIHGHHVGTDKLSHFLDIGHDFYYYDKVHPSIPYLLEWAKSQEEGMLGYTTTGVKSFGDISADMDGFRFWSELIGPKAHNPYFGCENGKLKQIRKFHWADWVTPAWTEAINCSAYQTSNYDTTIDQNKSAMESNGDARFHCPIVGEVCGALRKQYAELYPGEDLDMIISPGCR
jgi:hypothetical protein